LLDILLFEERLQRIEISIPVEQTDSHRTTRGVKNHAKYVDLMPKKQRMEVEKEISEGNNSTTVVEPEVQQLLSFLIWLRV
jgi:hypothetical protein